MTRLLIAVFIVSLIVATFLFARRYLSLWLQAWTGGAPTSLLQLVLMDLRQVDSQILVSCQVMAVQSGIDKLPMRILEAQYLAGGNVTRITRALIAASRAGLELEWNTAAAIDLAGRDIMEAVQVSISPKVIDCPDDTLATGDSLHAVSQDGIELLVQARLTVRTNLAQLVGGATEPTLVARIGQSIVTSVGRCEAYGDALRDPGRISRRALGSGLDAQTAFKFVSLDIAAIDIGRNIGARLQTDQAEADVLVALARASSRLEMAVAKQQEMRARYTASRAAVLRAEAEIPHAIAQVFRSEHLLQGPQDSRRSRPSAATRERGIEWRSPMAPQPALLSRHFR